ncbi:Uncharacterised protein [Sphingobacterium mizutaii]|uniref:Uncharacterized protein n=1 Tax=Sphingobacterium mizutaii TaxID=1010 RepID=A0AAJ4XCV1_9SPHI|nr:hypothetical protein SAMN05192578_10287 [Sphingobacterium mizutaii]SNV53138.1 Uncharacterised protein [Sphingobacterium mizutaii]
MQKRGCEYIKFMLIQSENQYVFILLHYLF